MLEQTGDVAVCRVGQLLLTLGIEEDVLALARQRLVAVHARAVLTEDRLRHEGRVQTELCGDGADHVPERDQHVSALERVGVAEVDLVLADRDLVVRGLKMEAHRVQHVVHGAPYLNALVHRTDVEVAGLVVRIDGGVALGVVVEDEELGFRADAHLEAHLLGVGDDGLECHAGVADERRAIRVSDVADDARHVAGRALKPRNHLERIEIGLEVHVRLLDALVPADRGAVEHHLVVEGLRQLVNGNLNVLELTMELGELQAHEADVLRLGLCEDFLLRHVRLRFRRRRPTGHAATEGRLVASWAAPLPTTPSR